VCPDAGADAGVDTRDATGTDTGSAVDVGVSTDVTPAVDVAVPDVATQPDVGSATDAPSGTPEASGDSYAPPVDAKGRADARDAGTEIVGEDAAPPPGANENGGESGDSGCSCRTASAPKGGLAWYGVALGILGLARRRRRR
jgi:MYXO-CTERM domain-containing protein